MASSQLHSSVYEFDAFLFDLDGTLLDTADDLGAALNTVLRAHGKEEVSREVYRSVASNGAGALLEVGFKDAWPNKSQSELTKELVEAYAENIAKHTDCFSGIESLLIALDQKNIKWGIMTNKPGFLTTPLVAAIPALKNALVVVSGDTCEEAKPSPIPLIYCAQQMSVQPSRCLYIGDAERDIQAGKAAGMPTATALWGYIPSEEEALNWQADFNWYSPVEGFNYI